MRVRPTTCPVSYDIGRAVAIFLREPLFITEAHPQKINLCPSASSNKILIDIFKIYGII